MPNLSIISLTINGKKIRFENLTYSSSIVNHHSLVVTTDAQDIGDPTGKIEASDIMDFIGKDLNLKIAKSKESKVSMVFDGIITNIQISKARSGYDQILITSMSKSFLADQSRHIASYTDMKLSKIASEAFSQWPSSITTKINNDIQLPYACQYHETAYNYIGILANKYGLFYYYNGRKLVLGEYEETHKVDANMDTEVTNIELSFGIQNTNEDTIAYSYEKHEVFKYKKTDGKPQTSDNYGESVKSASDEVYDAKTLKLSTQDIQSDADLQTLYTNRMNQQIAKMVILSAQSENPEIHIGARLNILNKGTTFGSYIITEVEHTTDFSGHYKNKFKGIPSNCKVPFPVQLSPALPLVNQIATVVEDKDPDHMSRVKVRFVWQKEGECTPWIRVAMPNAGEINCILFAPRIGDEVMVGFENGNKDKPYIIASMIHNESKRIKKFNKHYDKPVNAAIADKWNGIIFDDSLPGMMLYTKGGTQVVLKNNGRILIQGNNNIILQTGKVILDAKNIELKAEESIKMEAQTIEMSAQQDVKAKASINLELSGSQTKLSGEAITEVKGGLVKIN